MKMHLSHILVAQKFEADDVERKLKQGEPFEALAQKFSKCPSASQGGDLGDIDLRRLDDEFSEAAKLLKAGQISGPVRTRFGYHLIKRHS